MEEMKIKCYQCQETTGIAHQEGRTFTDPRTKKKKGVLVWVAEGWKQISLHNWLCSKCDKRRCKNCDILLSNKIKCDGCDKKHGAYYLKHPDYCEDCWDKKK